MPVWEFRCNRCGATTDLRYPNVAQADDDMVECSRCLGQMERQPSAPAFVVNGYSYKNGYTSKSNT